MEYITFKRLANEALKLNHKFFAVIEGGNQIGGDAYLYSFSKPNIINIFNGEKLSIKVNIDSIKEVK